MKNHHITRLHGAQKPPPLSMGHIEDRVIGLPEIAKVIGVCTDTMGKMAREGADGLPVKFVRGRWWASRRQLVAWCERMVGGEGGAQ